MSKPSIPKGTRDFLPVQMVKRKYIFHTIEAVFRKYGFLPIETPSMEKTETLMGKYGEEGDRLIFKVLQRGEKIGRAINNIGKAQLQFGESTPLEKLNPEVFTGLLNNLSEEALRYDLTVPFARFVVQHQNELSFPFKRYQIQPVWRADRPQKGRYREFYQCDVDIVGSDSLLNEVELVQIFDEVLSNLKIPDFTIKINNRKILSGLAEVVNEPNKLIDITVAIDKLDKIGVEKVNEELRSKGVSEKAIEILEPLLTLKGSHEEVMNVITDLVSSSEVGKKGIEELNYVFKKVKEIGLRTAKLEFSPSLARGLNYYTGAIFEVEANNVKIGSICGGGRYDDLTSVFGLKNLSGVGVSFGADRIYDVLKELDLFPKEMSTTTKILFVNFGDEEASYCLSIVKKIRDNGISAELYPDHAKMKKQMGYANAKNIPFVALVGSNEMTSNNLVVKNMISGEQNSYTFDELLEILN